MRACKTRVCLQLVELPELYMVSIQLSVVKGLTRVRLIFKAAHSRHLLQQG